VVRVWHFGSLALCRCERMEALNPSAKCIRCLCAVRSGRIAWYPVLAEIVYREMEEKFKLGPARVEDMSKLGIEDLENQETRLKREDGNRT
jgi:hypothetical protein